MAWLLVIFAEKHIWWQKAKLVFSIDLIITLIWLNFAESLWVSSAVSVVLAIVFVGICSAMAISALIQGETKTPRLLPELDDGVSFFNLFTAIPVVVTAFTFHFNGKKLHP